MIPLNQQLIAVDVETEGLRWYADKLHGIGIAWGMNYEESLYIPFTGSPTSDLRNLLLNPAVAKVGHKIRFDWKFLVQNGLPIAGPVWCTKILAHLLDENAPTGLKNLSEKIWGKGSLSEKTELDVKIKELKLKHVGELCALDLRTEGRPYTDLIGRYCREDAVNTFKLFQWQVPQLRELNDKVKRIFQVPKGPLDYYVEESMPAEAALRAMEQPGIALDRQEVETYAAALRLCLDANELALREQFKEHVMAIEARLFEEAKAERKSEKGKARVLESSEKYGTRFNFNSGPNLGELLFSRLTYVGNKTEAGNWRIDEAALVELKAKGATVDGILERRSLEKQLGTYAQGLLDRAVSGRIYAEYPQFTNTGRLSSENPNMQNIPRGCPVKRAFRPDAPDQVFIYADYSQVELRIAAHLSQDPVMLEWFQLGIDPHKQAAVSAFGVPEAEVTDALRQAAKRMNFLTIYDGGGYRLEEALREEGIKKEDGSFYTLKDCDAMLKGWWKAHPVYQQYLDQTLQTVSRLGALVSETGRVRRLPDIVYGQHLDWQGRVFRGPKELQAKLYNYSGEVLSSLDLFHRARKKYAHAKKQAYNFPIQSLGATITKLAIVKLTSLGFTVRSTVHDSILVQVGAVRAAAAVEQVRQIMEGAYPLSVPLKVDIKVLNSLDEKDIFTLPAIAA